MNAFRSEPNAEGFWGKYGGRFVAETLVAPLDELTASYRRCKRDPLFRRQLETLQCDYAGRPTPLGFAERLTEYCGGARIFLKGEGLLHTGAHNVRDPLSTMRTSARAGACERDSAPGVARLPRPCKPDVLILTARKLSPSRRRVEMRL
jgi:tryptophan synthase beta chain